MKHEKTAWEAHGGIRYFMELKWVPYNVHDIRPDMLAFTQELNAI